MISSPWMAALTNTTGPGRLPWMTCTGSVTGWWLASTLTGSSTVRRLPAAMSTLPMRKAARGSALATGAGLARRGVVLDELDDLAGHVDAGGGFHALQTGRGIDLHDHRAVVAAQQVHAGPVQAHRLGRTHGGGALFVRALDRLGAAAAMQVGAELAFGPGALHGGDHLLAHHQRADIGAAGFLDELLHQDVDLGAAEGLDHRLRRAPRFAKHHADALGAFEQLDDHRRAAAELDQLVGVG